MLDIATGLGIAGGFSGLVFTIFFQVLIGYGESVGDHTGRFSPVDLLIGLGCLVAMVAGALVKTRPRLAGIILLVVGFPLVVTFVWTIPAALMIAGGIMALRAPEPEIRQAGEGVVAVMGRIPGCIWVGLVIMLVVFGAMGLLVGDHNGAVFTAVTRGITPTPTR